MYRYVYSAHLSTFSVTLFSAKSKPRRLSVKANKKPMPVVVTERVPVKTGDTPDSVPPSYNEVLEKDKNDKSKPTSVGECLLCAFAAFVLHVYIYVRTYVCTYIRMYITMSL